MIPANGRADAVYFTQTSQRGVRTPAPRAVGPSGRTVFMQILTPLYIMFLSLTDMDDGDEYPWDF